MAIINEQFYENLDKKIDTIFTEEEAEEFVEQTFQPVIDQMSSVVNQVSDPLMESLQAYIGEANMIAKTLDPPTDPLDCIPWINKVVDVFTARITLIKKQIKPYLLQYNAAKDLINGMTSEINNLQSHFNSKMNEKGWETRSPSISFPTLPQLPDIPSILID